MAVILQNPIRGYFGGVTAGPVFKDVMTYALQQFKIPPTGAPPPVMKLKIRRRASVCGQGRGGAEGRVGSQRGTSAR